MLEAIPIYGTKNEGLSHYAYIDTMTRSDGTVALNFACLIQERHLFPAYFEAAMINLRDLLAERKVTAINTDSVEIVWDPKEGYSYQSFPSTMVVLTKGQSGYYPLSIHETCGSRSANRLVMRALLAHEMKQDFVGLNDPSMEDENIPRGLKSDRLMAMFRQGNPDATLSALEHHPAAIDQALLEELIKTDYPPVASAIALKFEPQLTDEMVEKGMLSKFGEIEDTYIAIHRRRIAEAANAKASEPKGVLATLRRITRL